MLISFFYKPSFSYFIQELLYFCT